jgi:drug/metabolite transporter (DMT)-like permease
MGAMLFYLRALQSEEASVVAPLFQTSTLFTFVLAYFLLGETLRWTGLLGAALIILGVLSLSFNSTFRLQKFKGRLVLLMMGSTFVLALSSVIFKFYAVKDEFWATTFWMFVGEALFGVGILLIPRYSKQFFFLLKKNTGPLLAVNGANELINLGGGLGVRFASLLAPLVLVSAVSSTTTLFVFAFGILLSLFLPRLGREDLSRANLIRKGIAALIVTAGVLLANLRA